MDGNAEAGPSTITLDSAKRKMRFAHRSRGGCLPCRGMKKKCDEMKPSCTRCSDADRACVYEAEGQVKRKRVKRKAKEEPAADSSALALDLMSPLPSPPSLHVPGQTISPSLLGPADPSPSPTVQSEQTFFTLPIPPSSSTLSCIPPPTNVDPDWSLSPFIHFHDADLNTTGPNSALSPVSSTGCDPVLWKAFIDSPLFKPGQPSDQTVDQDGSLVEYFTQFAAVTVCVSESENGANRTFYQALAELAAANEMSWPFLPNGIRSVAARHLANLARSGDDPLRASVFDNEAAKYRARTLAEMRVAVSKEKDSLARCPEVLPSTLLLLALSAILCGESDMLRVFLGRALSLLARVSSGLSIANTPPSSLLLSAASMACIYSVFDSISSGSIVSDKLSPPVSSHPSWPTRMSSVCETIAGVTFDMLKLFARAHDAVQSHASVIADLRTSPEDDELLFVELEIQDCASQIEREAEAILARWEGLPTDRTQLGHQMYRLAIRVMFLSGIVGASSSDLRIQRTIQEALVALSCVAQGSEIGMVWPWIIIASHSLPLLGREECLAWSERSCWKGSKSPKAAEEIVREVWKRQGEGKSARCREVARELGAPLMV